MKLYAFVHVQAAAFEPDLDLVVRCNLRRGQDGCPNSVGPDASPQRLHTSLPVHLDEAVQCRTVRRSAVRPGCLHSDLHQIRRCGNGGSNGSTGDPRKKLVAEAISSEAKLLGVDFLGRLVPSHANRRVCSFAIHARRNSRPKPSNPFCPHHCSGNRGKGGASTSEEELLPDFDHVCWIGTDG